MFVSSCTASIDIFYSFILPLNFRFHILHMGSVQSLLLLYIHSSVNLNSFIGLSSEFQFYNQPPVSLLYLYLQKYHKIKMKVWIKNPLFFSKFSELFIQLSKLES